MLSAFLYQNNINDAVIHCKIDKSLKHLSKLIMGEVCKREHESLFCFSHVNKEQIKVKRNFKFRINKASAKIQTLLQKSLKNIQIFFLDFSLSGFDDQIKTFIFPSRLKLSNITPVFSKGDKNLRENYNLVSILPNILKKNIY